MPKFEVGSQVRWTSSASGGVKEKVGRVIAVIEGGSGSAERAAAEIRSRVRGGTHRSAFGGGWNRDYESYVVEVPQGSTGRAKAVLYWPHPKGLLLA